MTFIDFISTCPTGLLLCIVAGVLFASVVSYILGATLTRWKYEDLTDSVGARAYQQGYESAQDHFLGVTSGPAED